MVGDRISALGILKEIVLQGVIPVSQLTEGLEIIL